VIVRENNVPVNINSMDEPRTKSRGTAETEKSTQICW
jgi:hypothetical protein